MLRPYNLPLMAALILISQSLPADEPASVPAAVTVESAHEEPGRAGLQVFIDEDTGEVRSPTEAEIAEIAEQFRQRFIDQAVEKPVVHHADGSMSKELGPQHRLYTVARLTDEGELETQCLPAEQAADFLADDDPSQRSPDDGEPTRE